MKVVLFDGMNLIHRARSGFMKGDNALTFSFFRSLKPLVEKFKPDTAYFVLEGRPKHRNELLTEYKANRPKGTDDFWRQANDIREILLNLPIIQIRHPDYECDDVIANLAKQHVENGNEVVVVSNDSDFIQLYDCLDNTRFQIWNPMKKKYVEKPDHNYLEWKALRGDSSDNIPGIKGVGDKTATKLMNDPVLLEQTLEKANNREVFERNKALIEFHWFSSSDKDLVDAGTQVKYPVVSMSAVYKAFADRGFGSMINEKYWSKFQIAFHPLVVNDFLPKVI